MRVAGIIAAGHGTRLAALHPGLPKPLVPVAGKPLAVRVAEGLRAAGAEQIVLLHNSRGRRVREALADAVTDARWTFLEADTASSWESFRLVSRALAEKASEFVVSTVDAVVAPAEVRRFWDAASSHEADAGLALTDFIDDEKPLWADVGPDGCVAALGDAAVLRRHATAGLYYMTRAAAMRMPEPAAHGSLRQYWTSLVLRGSRVAGVPIAKTVDVDRPEDVEEAERSVTW